MDWNTLKPHFSSNQVYVPSIWSSVQVGTFIKYLNDEEETFGQITSINEGYTNVNTFEVVRSDNRNVPPLRSMYLQRTQELFRTNEIIAVENISIVGIIFVFSEDDVLEGLYQIQGCTHSYLRRFRFDDDNVKTVIPNGLVRSFPDDYLDAFEIFFCEPTAMTIWRDIACT